MKKQYFSPDQDGFYGVYYPNSISSTKAMIIMLGESSDDYMVVSAVKWLHKRGCNALAMFPVQKGAGYYDYPLEWIGHAVQFLKTQGNQKAGIVGASTTGMMALVAASHFHSLTLTIALTPPDFITVRTSYFRNPC